MAAGVCKTSKMHRLAGSLQILKAPIAGPDSLFVFDIALSYSRYLSPHLLAAAFATSL